MQRALAIRSLQIVHVAVLAFVLTAPLLPSRPVWIAHLVFVPLMFVHWKTNKNRCVLTQIEARLKGEREVSESGFIKSLWISIFKRAPSEAALRAFINSILVVTWVGSLVRVIR